MTAEELHEKAISMAGFRIVVGVLIFVLGSAALGTMAMATRLSALDQSVQGMNARLNRRDASNVRRFESLNKRYQYLDDRLRAVEKRE